MSGKKTLAVVAGLGILGFLVLRPSGAHAAPASALPPGGLDANRLRDMFARSLLLQSTGAPGEFYVVTSSQTFDPTTDAAGPNNGLNLVRTMQHQANVVATPNILDEATTADRKIRLLAAEQGRPNGFVLLPNL
jgi:hypothetical protein